MTDFAARNTASTYLPTVDRTLPASARTGTGFGERVGSPASGRPGLLRTGFEVAADAAGPVGSIARGVASLVGGGGGASDARGEQMDAMWQMQRENQAFNLEYLALQEAIQAENRNFTTVSNLLRARHETAKGAIANIRA